MLTTSFLAIPDFSKSFKVETDASGVGVGTVAVLMQSTKPIALLSQALSLCCQLKSAYERELMTIIKVVKKWRHYLMHLSIIWTDQYSLKQILTQKYFLFPYSKWIVKLLGFNSDIQYKPGKQNHADDALSRYSLLTLIGAMTSSANPSTELEGVELEVSQDPHLKQIVKNLEEAQ